VGASTVDENYFSKKKKYFLINLREISRAQRCGQRFLLVLRRSPWLNKLMGHAVRSVGLSPSVRDCA
jgi:hypothetical protein